MSYYYSLPQPCVPRRLRNSLWRFSRPWCSIKQRATHPAAQIYRNQVMPFCIGRICQQVIIIITKMPQSRHGMSSQGAVISSSAAPSTTSRPRVQEQARTCKLTGQLHQVLVIDDNTMYEPAYVCMRCTLKLPRTRSGGVCGTVPTYGHLARLLRPRPASLERE